jgi:hypothetical protein
MHVGSVTTQDRRLFVMPGDHGQGDVRAYRTKASLLKGLSTVVIAWHREPASEAHHGACATNPKVRHPFELLYRAYIDDST